MSPLASFLKNDTNERLKHVYGVSDAVEMIHPARFLFNAGNTPKQWNSEMLNDPHLKVLYYEQNSKKVFSNTEIKGGILASLLYICYVSSNIILLDLIHILYLACVQAPALKQAQGLFISLHALGSELLALAIDHELIYLPVKGQIGHKIAPFCKLFCDQ